MKTRRDEIRYEQMEYPLYSTDWYYLEGRRARALGCLISGLRQPGIHTGNESNFEITQGMYQMMVMGWKDEDAMYELPDHGI